MNMISNNRGGFYLKKCSKSFRKLLLLPVVFLFYYMNCCEMYKEL